MRLQGKWDKKRIVPLSHTLEAELSEHIQTLPEGCPFVICHNNQKPISYKAYYRWYEKALTNAEIEKKGRKPHCFRHTFITKMEQAGMQRHILQAIVGHSNSKTTQGYIHYEPAFLVESFRQTKVSTETA